MHIAQIQYIQVENILLAFKTFAVWLLAQHGEHDVLQGMKKMCSSVCSFVTYVQALLKHDRLLNTKEQALAIVEKKRKKNAV